MTKERPIPKYMRIYESLKDSIQSGEYARGALLPYERELCAQYGAQRITVRHALELLANEGLIQRRAGVGSFVTDPFRAEEQGEHAPSGDLHKSVLFIMTRNTNDVRTNTNAYNSHLFFAMERACRDHRLSLIYLPTADVDELRQRVESDPPACALLVSHTAPEIVQYLLDASIPAIVINSIDRRLTSILPDNFSGIQMAMDYLFSLNHSRIGFIGGIEHYVNAKERLLAYRVAHWQRGLTPDERWIRSSDWTAQGGRAAMQSILALPEDIRPTAVLCASDMMSFGAYKAIQSASLSVGQDISVMGFDNVPMSDYMLPHLSTVDVCLDQMTQIAMDHLLREIQHKGRAQGRYTVRVSVNLIKRSSCAPYK